MHGGRQRTVKQPAYEAQTEYIAAFQHALVVEGAVGQGCLGEGGHRHLQHLGADAQLAERVGSGEFGLVKISLLERVYVDYDHSAILHVAAVLFESGGIHRHQHIALVAGGVHTRAHTHLKSRYAAERTLRSAYFRRIVGEGRYLVADAGRHVGEDIANELHAVARIAREADHHLVHGPHFCLFCHDAFACNCTVIDCSLFHGAQAICPARRKVK